MKKIEDIPVEDLRRVFQQLFNGLWGDDKDITEPIKLTSNVEPEVKNTADRARIAIREIHRDRIDRVGAVQWKNPGLDVLLLGVTEKEFNQVTAAIQISLRDYLRPLAELVGLWDEDDEDEAETELALAGLPEGEPGEEKKDEPENQS